MTLERIRFKEISFNENGWHVDSDGRMFIRAKFTSDKADRIGDIIMRDATTKAVEEWRKWGNIRLQHNPNRPVGTVIRAGEKDGLGWNVLEAMIVDPEAKELVKAGVLKAMSVGIIPLDFDIIEEEDIDFEKSPLAKVSWLPAVRIKDYLMVEISLVDHPMNYDAILQQGEKNFRSMAFKFYGDEMESIMDRVSRYAKASGIHVKGATSFQNLAFASDETSWDGSGARDRVAKWASSDGSGDKDKIDWQRYRKAFFWFDADDSENLGAYKLPFADVFDGSLKAVWRGVTAAAAATQGARGGVDIPESDMSAVKNHIGRYYSKHGDTPPWEEESSMTEEMEKNMEEVETADPEASDEAMAVEATEKEADVPTAEPEVTEAPEAVEAEEEKAVEAEEVEEEIEEVESEAEVEETEPVEQEDPVLDAILALNTQIEEMQVKILTAIEKAFPTADEKQTEMEEPEQPEEEKSADLDEFRKSVLEEVRAMVEELKMPVARKSAVDVEEPEVSYESMSLDQLNAELRSKISKVVPNRI